MTTAPEHADTSSILGRMSGSPRRVVDELEILVEVSHVVKLQVTSPMTEKLAIKEACMLVRQGIASMDPSVKMTATIVNHKER